MMIRNARRRRMAIPFLVSSLLVSFTVCDSRPLTAPEPESGELVFRVVSGDAQRGAIGFELPQPVVIQALDRKGHPIKNQLVNFKVTKGGGSMFAGAAITDKNGVAQDYWTLGPDLGENRLEVRSVDPTTGEKLVYATLTATGIPVPVTTVDVVPNVATLGQLEIMEFRAIARDPAGGEMPGRVVQWSMSGPDGIAYFVYGGVVQATNPGIVTITATIEGVTGTARLTVVPFRVQSISIIPNLLELPVGGTGTLEAITFGPHNMLLTGRTVTWRSLDPSIATVTSAGVVRAVSKGDVFIEAISEGVTSTAWVRVRSAVASLTLTPSSQTVLSGEFGEVRPVLRDAAGNLVTDRTISWEVSDRQVLSFSSGEYASFYALKAGGPVTITARVDHLTATATVTVRDLDPDAYEPNETPATAWQLPELVVDAAATNTTAYFHSLTDSDWFRVRVRGAPSCLTGSAHRLSVRLTDIPVDSDYNLEIRSATSPDFGWAYSAANGRTDEVITQNLYCGEVIDVLIHPIKWTGPLTASPYRLVLSLTRQ